MAKWHAAVLLAAAFSATEASSQRRDDLPQHVPVLQGKHKVPGTALALIENGRVVSTHGFGWADVKRRIPVTSRTLFNVGSISKPLTALATVDLARSRALDLDAPVERYLGGWRFPSSQFDSSGVTLRRILSHTAGLSVAGVWAFRSGEKLPPLRETLSSDTPYPEEIDSLWDGKGGVRIILPPGTKWRYSGGGYALAQLAIENVTRREFAGHMKRTVLRRLGMKHTTFGEPPRSLARPYGKDGEEVHPVVFNASSAAGMISNAEDLGRFVSLLAASRPPLAEMLRPQPNSAPNPWGNDGWGLGFPLERLPDGRRLVFHFGGNEGFVGAIAAIPESKSGLVVLTNSSNGLPFCFEVLCRWLSTRTTSAPDLCSGIE